MIIKLKDFTDCPGPRLRSQGPNSGEEWRDDHVIPALLKAQKDKVLLFVDLDGVVGFSAAFLEEVFGGLGRKTEAETLIQVVVLCLDEAGIDDDIYQYMWEADDVEINNG